VLRKGKHFLGKIKCAEVLMTITGHLLSSGNDQLSLEGPTNDTTFNSYYTIIFSNIKGTELRVISLDK